MGVIWIISQIIAVYFQALDVTRSSPLSDR